MRQQETGNINRCGGSHRKILQVKIDDDAVAATAAMNIYYSGGVANGNGLFLVNW